MVADANRAYFQAFGLSRGSLSRLPSLSLVVGFLILVCNVGPLNVPNDYLGYEVLGYLADANVALIWLCVVVCVVAMFKGLTYRYQVLFSAAMTGMAVLLVYAPCLLAVSIATLIQARGERIYAILFAVVGLFALVLVLVATAVHAKLLRRRLIDGHSEKRLLGNFIAVSSSNRSRLVWIGLGAALVVPTLLTQGQYIVNIVGLVVLLIFAAVIPSVAVECAYLTRLRFQDKSYWERRPSSKGRQRGLRRSSGAR